MVRTWMPIYLIVLTVKFGLISKSAASPSSHRSSRLFRNLYNGIASVFFLNLNDIKVAGEVMAFPPQKC